jgi:hypothetical protein
MKAEGGKETASAARRAMGLNLILNHRPSFRALTGSFPIRGFRRGAGEFRGAAPNRSRGAFQTFATLCV